MGSPIVSARTQKNSSVYLCCIRNGIKLCTYSFPLAFKSSTEGRIFVKVAPAFFADRKDAYGFFPMIALAAKAVIIPYGKFTSSR